MKQYLIVILGVSILVVLNSCRKNANDPCYICTEDLSGIGITNDYEICDRKACINNTSCINIDDDMTHEEWARQLFGSDFSTICRRQ